MNFNEKLQHLRASRKLSQEELAGRLDVSRQAVTKWENGQAFPDFPNLVRLSELFGVSIDRLVRQEEECAPALLDPDPASEKALRRFLMRAKKRTYASGQNTAPPSRPQSHDFRYSEQDYLYIDTYLGSRNFTGEEAVWIRDTPVWALNYYGVSLDETFYSAFLKEALSQVPAELPLRGPEYFRNEDFTYVCRTQGTLGQFQGEEAIYCREVRIYTCLFHGGRLS